jgi:hypothetical protein
MARCLESTLVRVDANEVWYEIHPCGEESNTNTLVIVLTDLDRSHMLGSTEISPSGVAIFGKVVRAYRETGEWPKIMGFYS